MMHEPETTQNPWIPIITETLAALETTLALLLKIRGNNAIPARYFIMFVRQGIQTLAGIRLLHENNLKEPSQILVRTLAEATINFDVFYLKFLRDPNDTLLLLHDAMMLDKIKQMKSTVSPRRANARRSSQNRTRYPCAPQRKIDSRLTEIRLLRSKDRRPGARCS